MRANRKQWGEGEADTPYKKARQEWDDRLGSSRIQASSWRYVAFICLVMVFFAIGGMIYLGAQPKAVPHIVEMHPNGEAVYRGSVGEAWENYQPTNMSIRFHIRRFIEDTRTVSSDPQVTKRNWLDAYKLISPSAANTLSTYAQKNDPFKQAQEKRVYVETFTSAIPVSKDSWQFDWTEVEKDKRGNVIDTNYWRGMFRIVMQKPDSVQKLDHNPIGLYIDEFNWSEINR